MTRRKKITWIVLGCIVAFVLFNLVLAIFPINKKYIYKDKERGEEYIYAGKKYPVVFVGSGLIGDLNGENLGRQRVYNLFFPYSGSCTGVELIALARKIPDTLFIETNYIFKGFNTGLNQLLFQPFAYQSKFLLPCLREKNQLLPLAKEIIKGGRPRQKISATLPEPLYTQSLNTLRKEYNGKIDSAGYRSIVEKLKKEVDYFSSQLCTVIFFEMPVDKEFLDCPKTKWERETLRAVFNDKKFIWSPVDSSRMYATSDGIHLLNESLEKYIHYFNSNLTVQ